MSRLPRLAIATLAGLDHFIPALAGALQASGMVEVRLFPVRGPPDLRDALAWADRADRDAIWFEFCWSPFPSLIASTDFGGRRVIVRVHRIEAYETDLVARTDWAKVSDVIVVSQDMARCVREARPQIETATRLHVIHNGVDIDGFSDRTRFDRFRIGWCGAFIGRKNPTLALQILYELRQRDPRYHLRLAISTAERLTMEAFCHQAAVLGLAESIGLDGRIAADAMPGWHAANGVLRSTSLHESFGYAIAEAAAAGCDLAVLDHLGAAEFWPAEMRFVALDEAVRIIDAAEPDRWRRHVALHFSMDRQVTSVLAVLGRSRPTRPIEAARRSPVSPWLSSADYWEQRYQRGGTSGAGSFGRLAEFKAHFLNRLVAEHAIASVLELGCGDGRQLALADYRSYVGVDVSPAALDLCRERFVGDPDKQFLLAGTAEPPDADLTLSIDVVFHLVEDDVFEAHMRCLFDHARRLVVVYASDHDQPTAEPHVRHRAVSAWVGCHARAWERIAHVPNPYGFDRMRPDQTSFADFHVYARRQTAPA